MIRRKEMIDKSGQMGVPVILIDDKIIVGFNKSKIMELLGIKE
jgi:glutaredoxin